MTIFGKYFASNYQDDNLSRCQKHQRQPQKKRKCLKELSKAKKESSNHEILIVRQVQEAKYFSGIPDLKLTCLKNFNPGKIKFNVFENDLALIIRIKDNYFFCSYN